jgi:hypothetical protein
MAGPRAKRSAAVAAAIGCAALIACLLASPAAAFHIPGAHYSGNAGSGTVSFDVSGDGSSVTNLTLNNIEGPNCTGSKQYGPIPITNNTFDNGEVSGGFPNPRGAYGHYNILLQSFPTACRATGTWSAITNASPNGSAECKKAMAKVRKKKRALARARRTGSERAIKRARKKWSKARAQRDKYCII